MKYVTKVLAEKSQNQKNSKYVKRIGWLFLLMLILLLSSKIIINVLYYSNSEIVIAEILKIEKIDKVVDAYGGYKSVHRYRIKYQYNIESDTYTKIEEISNTRLNSLGYLNIRDNLNVKVQYIKLNKRMSRITSKKYK